MEPDTSNEQLFRIIIEEGFSKGDVTVFDKYTSQGFVEHRYGFFPPNVRDSRRLSIVFIKRLRFFYGC